MAEANKQPREASPGRETAAGILVVVVPEELMPVLEDDKLPCETPDERASEIVCDYLIFLRDERAKRRGAK